MLKVGLTGGLACGKSFAGQALEELGCLVIEADRLGHEALAPGGAAFGPVVREFGAGILDASGGIDRQALALLVFGHPGRLEQLNRLVHPAVLRREEELAAAFAAREPHGIAVVAAAILIETGSYRRFDKIVLVECSGELQIERAMKRGGMAESSARLRIERQMPLEEKRKYADFLIDTSGDKEHTLEQTRTVFEALRRLAK
jgi:dephospho-CoA kinase